MKINLNYKYIQEIMALAISVDFVIIGIVI